MTSVLRDLGPVISIYFLLVAHFFSRGLFTLIVWSFPHSLKLCRHTIRSTYFQNSLSLNAKSPIHVPRKAEVDRLAERSSPYSFLLQRVSPNLFHNNGDGSVPAIT